MTATDAVGVQDGRLEQATTLGTPWWLIEALEHEGGARPSVLVGDACADVVVVGGGFTGLWTAYFLTEIKPDLGIVVLEQDICGGGPSGRNGGFASGWWDELDGLVALYGAEAAVKSCRAISESINSIGQFCWTNWTSGFRCLR